MPLEISQEQKNQSQQQAKISAAEAKAKEKAAVKAEAITLEEEKVYRRGVVNFIELTDFNESHVSSLYVILFHFDPSNTF